MSNLNLPPGPVLAALKSPEVLRAVKEYRRLAELEAELQEKAYLLRTTGMAAAEAQDTDAIAEAFRRDQPIPKAGAAEVVQAQLAACERHGAGAAQAKASAAAELVEAVESRRSALAKSLGERVMALRQALQGALVALDDAQAELTEAVSLQSWVNQFPGNKPFRSSGGLVLGLIRRSGEPYAWTEVISELNRSASGAVTAAHGPMLLPGQPQTGSREVHV